MQKISNKLVEIISTIVAKCVASVVLSIVRVIEFVTYELVIRIDSSKVVNNRLITTSKRFELTSNYIS